MDELSWRARLAKSNVNILDIHNNMMFVEFTYHPKPGTFKWCKTVVYKPDDATIETITDFILDVVLKLRKELEQ